MRLHAQSFGLKSGWVRHRNMPQATETRKPAPTEGDRVEVRVAPCCANAFSGVDRKKEDLPRRRAPRPKGKGRPPARGKSRLYVANIGFRLEEERTKKNARRKCDLSACCRSDRIRFAVINSLIKAFAGGASSLAGGQTPEDVAKTWDADRGFEDVRSGFGNWETRLLVIAAMFCHFVIEQVSRPMRSGQEARRRRVDGARN